MATKHLSRLLLATTIIGAAGAATPASAQDYLLGEILKTPYNFCPRNTLQANGAILSIAQNTALFALYGTTYGGNGQTTFALPDLRGRATVHTGQGPGLSPYDLGEVGGTETNTMTEAQMPRHDHVALVRTTTAAGDSRRAFRNAFGTTPANKYVSGTTPASQLMNRDTVIIRPTGEGQSYNHRSPLLAIQYCVVTGGIFPARN
jgi:microcystin-dependent protein